jgi:hypothetical protein
MFSEMINAHSQIKQAIRECEVRYRELETKLRQRDEGQRKNNIIIFGLQEKREENCFETKLFRNPRYDGQVAELISESRDNNREYHLCS